jgi:hypothetical protein
VLGIITTFKNQYLIKSKLTWVKYKLKPFVFPSFDFNGSKYRNYFHLFLEAAETINVINFFKN